MSEEKFAEIYAERVQLPFGTHYDKVEWRGKPFWPVKIYREWLQEYFRANGSKTAPFEVEFRGFKLCFIRSSPYSTELVYARVDGNNYFTWAWLRTKALVRNLLLPIYCRLILTLMVWGLADVPPGSIISWRQIHRPRPAVFIARLRRGTL